MRANVCGRMGCTGHAYGEKRPPSIATLERWSWDGEMKAIDGCGGVEDDGHCAHGKPSWLLCLGMI
jgi:hypothetical protein